MKVIWGTVGILLVLILISFVVNKSRRSNMVESMLPFPRPNMTAPSTASTDTTVKEVVVQPTPVILPIIVNNWNDCTSSTYQNNLDALYTLYISAKNAYEAELSASGPNVIALRRDENIAYTNWYNEKRKCVSFI